MTNQEISKILSEIGEYLEMQDVPFKPRAYEKVAEAIAALPEEVSDIYQKGGLKAVEDIPGVGISIAEKIEELLKTGRLKYYDDLKKKTPVDLGELSAVVEVHRPDHERGAQDQSHDLLGQKVIRGPESLQRNDGRGGIDHHDADGHQNQNHG